MRVHEEFYFSLMEWMLNKTPSLSNVELMIDDTDKIQAPLVLEIIIQLYDASNEYIKHKVKTLTYKDSYSFLDNSRYLHVDKMEHKQPYGSSVSWRVPTVPIASAL